MDDSLCLLVSIGGTEQGRKELVAVEDGFRQSRPAGRPCSQACESAFCAILDDNYLPLVIGESGDIVVPLTEPVSSTARKRTSGDVLAARPRMTARFMMPSMAVQLSCNCQRLLPSAQSTWIVRQPCSGQQTRGTSAATLVWNWQVSRCHQ